ncbi:hypothetical protein H0H92_013061, partial [Tricholoma furcatifolium]
MAASPPEYVYGSVLPHKTLNVLDLLKFTIPPINQNTTGTLNHDVFSKSPSMISCAASTRALLQLQCPPLQDIDHLASLTEQAIKDGFISFDYTCDGFSIKLSFWVLEYWKAVHEISHMKSQWARAKDWLDERAEGRQVIQALARLPWRYDLPRAMSGTSLSLALYASNQWLSSTHTVQM